jgi:5-formyltetrahydrofolate cyclo-ligase
MTPSPSAAYAQVAIALRKLALSEPWTTDGLLPAEPALMERFGVSRGTLRRAVDELVREGLLRPDRGRGTYVQRHAQLRAHMKDALLEVAIPDSRSHLDVLRFVPDFAGSAAAHTRVRAMAQYREASVLFIAPDNSLRGLVHAALDDGKRVVVPTYAMRRGMVLLDPAAVPPQDREFASTLDGLERFGATLTLDELRALGRIDVLVTGAIALTRSGVHIGSGDAFFDIEWGILSTLGLVTAGTPILAVAHPVQIVDAELQPKAHDITVDEIITEDAVTATGRTHTRPTGIDWSNIAPHRLSDIAYLYDLAPAETEWNA